MIAFGSDGKSRVRRSIEIEDDEVEQPDLEGNTAEGAGSDAGTAAEPIIEDDGPEDAEGHAGDKAAEAGDADGIVDGAALAVQLAEAQDRYARLQAEWDNYRKRTAAERAEERSRAAQRLVENLLPVVDDMERAIANAQGGQGAAKDDPMLEGVKAISAKLTDILAREGLVAIDPQDGDAFDIHLHQAVGKVDDASVPDETVRQVYQKGYRMGDKLLRPAMVVVTTGGPKRTAEQVGETR